MCRTILDFKSVRVTVLSKDPETRNRPSWLKVRDEDMDSWFSLKSRLVDCGEENSFITHEPSSNPAISNNPHEFLTIFAVSLRELNLLINEPDLKFHNFID